MINMPKFNDEEWYQEKVLLILKDIGIGIQGIDHLLYLTLTHDEQVELNGISGHSLLEKLLIAPFPFLKSLYERFTSLDEHYFQIQDISNGKWATKIEWQAMLKIYSMFSKEKYKINTQLIEKYGIRSCPYCNENYIFNRGRYSSAQLDHFFPKNQYPILALSLYNLVPCCTTCNHIKSTKKLLVSPHDQSRDFSKMRISYRPKGADWIDNADSINIEFLFSQGNQEFEEDMRKNLEVLHVDYSYKQHKDYAQEILKKIQIYNNDCLDMILQNFPSLFLGKEDLLQAIYGNYISEGDLLKRPLSKMTRDILAENGII